MTDHWKGVRTFDCVVYGDGRLEHTYYGDMTSGIVRGDYASVSDVDAARAKDAEALERTQAALDKAVETLCGVSRGCESPRSEHVASIGRFVSEGLAEVKRLHNRDHNAELAAKDAEITRIYTLLDWALNAHAAGKRREDILATTLANVMHDCVEP